ncbi:MAG: 5-(carboxyamino)imidazole ribonucleotide synthase [Woeseiaceae bacterium]
MRVGIIGGGQLGRMLALSGIPLGLQFSFLDPGDNPCAGALGDVVKAPFDDAEAIIAFSKQCDVLTFEFENIPAELLSDQNVIDIQPGANALYAAQERSREKSLFEHCDIPVAPWRAIDDQTELDQAIAELGLPLIAKTRSLGYDGKGQSRIKTASDANDLFAEMGSVGLIVERLVDFDKEVSIIGTRDAAGHFALYPITENRHHDGILIRSETATQDKHLSRQAIRHFKALTDHLGYVGTLAIEFFVKDQLLLGNEYAPRVHNSGHWTQNGAPYSQFENHVRAITGLPLGPTDLCRPSGMLNLIGQMPEAADVIVPNSFFHHYAKDVRPGRKVGHINVIRNDQTEVGTALDELSASLGISAGFKSDSIA